MTTTVEANSALVIPSSTLSLPPTLPFPPLMIRFDNTLGAILIGDILTAMLFGVTTLQIYIYFNRNARDSLWLKKMMIFLLILDALHFILASHAVYYYCVQSFMNPLALTKCTWSFAVDMVLGGLSEAIVTGIFAYRIWRFSSKIWPVLLIVPPTLVGFAGATAIGNFALKIPVYTEFEERYAWIWYMTFGVQSFADIAIAASLSTILIKHRTGFRRTDSIIRTLITYSINTCALTSSVSVASIITYVAMPDNLIFLAFAMVLPKLMLNSLLALLNSRGSIRDMNSREPLSIHLSGLGTVAASDSPTRLSGSTRHADSKNEDSIICIAAEQMIETSSA